PPDGRRRLVALSGWISVRRVDRGHGAARGGQTMRRAAALVLTSCLAGATLVMASAPERAAQEPAFRVSTDLVTVDVLVFRGREPVQGLTASDFELTDNGVRQTVTSINVP